MGFMGQKKFGDDRKYFWFQVRFRGLITLGVWKSAKNIQKLLKLASLKQWAIFE